MDKIQTNRLNNNFQNTSQQNYFNVILQTEMTDFRTLTYTSSSQLPALHDIHEASKWYHFRAEPRSPYI